MVFRRVTVRVEYPLGKNGTAKKGDFLVTEGVYQGPVTSAEYPNSPTHRFLQKDSRLIGLNGGHLNYMAEEGFLQEGHVYNVIYDGKEKLNGGKFNGKEAHKFLLEEDTDQAPVAVTHADTAEETIPTESAGSGLVI